MATVEMPATGFGRQDPGPAGPPTQPALRACGYLLPECLHPHAPANLRSGVVGTACPSPCQSFEKAPSFRAELSDSAGKSARSAVALTRRTWDNLVSNP